MYQKLNRVEQILFDAGALFLLLFYVFSAVIMPMATQYHRGIYTLVTYVLVFLLYRSKSKWMRIVDYLLMLASMVCIGYWIMNSRSSITAPGQKRIWIWPSLWLGS